MKVVNVLLRLSTVTYFDKKTPSFSFERVQNMPLNNLYKFLPLVNGAFDRLLVQVYQKAKYIKYCESYENLYEFTKNGCVIQAILRKMRSCQRFRIYG